MTFVGGLAQISWPVAATLGHALLVGAAVRTLATRWIGLPTGIWITASIGLGPTVVLMTLAHVTIGDVTAPIWPMAVGALIILLIALLRGALRVNLYIVRTLVTPADLAAIALTVLALTPVAHYGLTYWTTGTMDFPSYIASAEIWTSSPETFREKHPDAFGRGQLRRAEFEKPMMTSQLVLMSEVSGLPPYRLLAPLTSAALFLLFGALVALCMGVFGLNVFISALAVAIPGFSVIPMSRVFDAQPGQVAAVALLACMTAVLTLGRASPGLRNAMVLGGVAAPIGAAALGTNFTLVTGCGLTVAGLLVWLSLNREGTLRLKFGGPVTAGLIALALSAPIFGMYWVSFRGQTTGEPGFLIPLATPLAAIGQQLALTIGTSTAQALLGWYVVLGGLLAVILSAPKSRQTVFDLGLFAMTLLNGAIIGIRLGWDNYATHKWLAVAIALVMPIAVAHAFRLLPQRARPIVLALMVFLAASSIYNSYDYGRGTTLVTKPDLLALGESPELSRLASVNLRMGELHQNSIAALMVPAASVTVTQRTYAEASPPSAGPFLVPLASLRAADAQQAVKLNGSYALSDTLIEPDSALIDFTSASPESARFLFGSWHSPEPSGTWSAGAKAHIAFDVPPDLRQTDVNLLITGNAYAHAGTERFLSVLVNGVETLETSYPRPWGYKSVVPVSQETIDKHDGRLVLTFAIDKPLSPAQFGSPDGRTLGFHIHQIAISPAGK